MAGVSGVEVFYGADWPRSNIDVSTRAYYLAGSMDLNHFVTGRKKIRYTLREKVFFYKLMLEESNKEGKKAAYALVNRLARDVDTDNRGIKTKNLRVIRRTYCPALLIEVGFLSSSWEAVRLAKAAHRLKTAKSIAASVLAFLKKNVKKQ